jgi:transcriptional regulator with XRE-family HTH domain
MMRADGPLAEQNTGTEFARSRGIRMVSDDNTPSVSLCARLRRERERRQIALSSISANTKISASLFEALERGDVSRWPSGIFRRSFIRAYAGAIGLDPDTVAREFLEQFPDPLDPPAPAAPAEPAPLAAMAGKSSEITTLRLKLADTPTPFARGRVLARMRHRWAAVACDGGLVVAIALCVFIACDKFWLPLAVAMLGYYLGGILVLGNTPGVCLFAPGEASGAHYNQPSDEASPDPGAAHSPWHFRMPAR